MSTIYYKIILLKVLIVQPPKLHNATFLTIFNNQPSKPKGNSLKGDGKVSEGLGIGYK